MKASSGRNPKWLEPLWEKKRRDTATRVERAVKDMVKRGDPVTLEGIRAAVLSLFGISISANTIQRNDDANATYQKHRTARRVTRPRNGRLAAMLRELPDSKAVNLRAKINRLRRKSKDNLIARLLAVEEERKRQAEREDALREEILLLHPSTRKRGRDQ